MSVKDGEGSRSFVLLMSAAIFLLGLGQLLVLPPFEGIDEPAYYSSIRQVAETGTVPLVTRSFISPDVIDYRQHGPMPYGLSITHTTRPPVYGGSEIFTYAQFFAAPEMMKDYRARYRETAPRVPYQLVTEELNWESQHPPLYFLLMAPVMKLTDALPFVTQFFIVRLVSFAMGMAGLLIALRATLRDANDAMPRRFIMAGFLLYPLLFPEFFLEFGRIGNDSLCLLLMGIAWHFLLRWRRDPADKRLALATGVCLGLGLLTKAFFMPILAGIFAFCIFEIIRRHSADRQREFTAAGFMLAAALLIGGGWYLFQYITFGSLTGSGYAIALAKHGGLIPNLQKQFVLSDLLLSLDVMLTSVSWAGSESITYIGAPHKPVFLLMLWLGYCSLRMVLRQRATGLAWLPVFLLVPFAGGLLWCILVSLAGIQDFIGGWYLHMLAPALGLAIGYALWWIAGGRKKRIVFWALLAYAVAFLAIVFWAQASLFAGCATKAANSLYQFPSSAFCLDRIDDIAARLGVIGWPYAAMVCFALGFLFLLPGLWKARRIFSQVPP